MKPLVFLVTSLVFTAPAFAASPRTVVDRCDAAWLTAAAAAANDPAALTALAHSADYLSADSHGRKTINRSGRSALCDRTVWRYLGSLRTESDFSAAWRRGLADQIVQMQRINSYYRDIDTLGVDALTKAETAVTAALRIGLVTLNTGGNGTARLQENGLTAAVFSEPGGYAALANATPSGTVALEDVAAGLQLLLIDRPSAPANAPGEPVVGSAVLDFRRAIVALASRVTAGVENDAAAAAMYNIAALTPEVGDPLFTRALHKVANSRVTDESDATSPHAAAGPQADNEVVVTADAAYTTLIDVGLRNQLATRAAAVAVAVSAAGQRRTTDSAVLGA